MTDKQERVLEILTRSFETNQSANFVIRQDRKKEKRMRLLIAYSLVYGDLFGKIYLSEDHTACAIVLDSARKKVSFRSMIWDLRLVFGGIGLRRVGRVMKREALIKSRHPKEAFYHLWYLGVNPDYQGQGRGSALLEQVMQQARENQRALYLETSTERNFAFYERHGFKEVCTIADLGYSLRMYCVNP